MAAKTCWHRYETKLRLCHLIYMTLDLLTHLLRAYVRRLLGKSVARIFEWGDETTKASKAETPKAGVGLRGGVPSVGVGLGRGLYSER